MQTMNLFSFLIASLAIVSSFASGHSGAEELECTHGKLYLVDDSTANLYVMNMADGHLDELNSVEDSIAFPEVAAGQLILQSSGSGREVVVFYRGNATLGFQDGFVRVVDTGVSTHSHDGETYVEYEAPSLVSNAAFDCARAIHYVTHDDKIAIFCDGTITVDPQVNSTVWVLDETRFRSTSGSAIVYSETLQGSHHGVAIPVDDGHVLYSLAHPNRINREPDAAAYALPETFQVVDFDGKVLRKIDNTTSIDSSCAGFHGSTAQDNTFALACDASHGGILIVDYDATAGVYTSRALEYPSGEEFATLRTGSFAEHPEADYVVGSFGLRGGTDFYLLAFATEDISLSDANLLPLSANQCAYQFELGAGHVLLVFMPNGFLHAFEFNGSWTEVAKKEIVPGMTTCAEAAFTPGVSQAFIAKPGNKKLYSVDLSHVDDGEMDVYETTLPFTPSGMVVSGLAKDSLCDGHENHNHGVGSGAVSFLAFSWVFSVFAYFFV